MVENQKTGFLYGKNSAARCGRITMLGGFERMTGSQDMMPAKIESVIRQILSDDWDPIGLHGWPPDEYDRYIGQVYRILIGSHSEDELTNYLFNTARDIGGAQD